MADDKHGLRGVLDQAMRHRRRPESSKGRPDSFSTRSDDDHDGFVFVRDPREKSNRVAMSRVVSPACRMVAKRRTDRGPFLREYFSDLLIPIRAVRIDRCIGEIKGVDYVKIRAETSGEIDGNVESTLTLWLPIVAYDDGCE
jgi:hypothetical protein